MKNGKVKDTLKDKASFLYIALYNYRMKKKIKNIHALERIPVSAYPEQLCRLYKERLHRDLNLDSPQSYTEKIQWLKLYDSTDEKANWTDKIQAKTLAAERIGCCPYDLWTIQYV